MNRTPRYRRWLFGLVLLMCALARAVSAAAADDKTAAMDSSMAFSEYFLGDTEPTSQTLGSSAVGQDSAYVIGPGDVLDIMVWGKLQALYTVEVSWDGALMPVSDSRANVEDFFTFWPGSVSVDKKSLSEIQKLMNNAFARYIKEDVRVSVKVSKPRRIRVQIMGQVAQPHEYTFDAGTTIVKAIASAGYTPRTSLRRISLQRRSTMGAKGADLSIDSTSMIDLYRYFVDYDMRANAVLQNGDVIQIPLVEAMATTSGGVNVPGLYEILPGERLSDLVRFSRGLAWSAEPSRTFLERREHADKFVTLNTDLSFIMDDTVDDSGDIPIQNRDSLIVLQAEDFQSYVKVVFDNLIGEKQDVAGTQELQKIMALADGLTMIQLFARFRDKLINADLSNITLLRDGQKIRINYLGILSAPDQDMVLRHGDVIYVPKSVEYVYVLGEVNTPAMIKYGRDASILEYIAQAGGYKQTAKLAIVTVLHTADNNHAKEIVDLKDWIKSGERPAGGEILPGDIIIVPKDTSFKFSDYVDIFNSVIPTLSFLKIID